MGWLSPWHIAVVAVAVLLFFGRGRISSLLGEIGEGIGKFRRGIRSDDS